MLIFIGTATRLSAARREQRFAAMRLVGATPRQISVVAAVEATVAAVAGTAVGFGLFFAFRGPLAGDPVHRRAVLPQRPVAGRAGRPARRARRPGRRGGGGPGRAAPGADLPARRHPAGHAPAAAGVPADPARARRRRAGYFVGRRPETSDGQTAVFLPGLLLIMAGLVLAGPWLTMVGARVMARRASRPATLIAARRLADNPKAGFRAISGLMLALFVTSVAVGVITTIVANRGPAPTGSTDAGHRCPAVRSPRTPPVGARRGAWPTCARSPACAA